ncbi:MAG: DUF177 domain-containing protein [Candidatus Edwardsbacteria bacterium]|jgi:uncharacterized protein|nr:DUF177 domain-containing protein [Candidatus Edwardsbacteria bacterium]
MKLKLRELPEGRTALRIDQPPAAHQLPGCGPLRGGLAAERTGDVVLVTGELRFSARLTCSRCLRPFTRTFGQEIDLCYRPAATVASPGRERELSADDLATIEYRKGEIDLWPELREAALLALPLKPLCREDCRGICPSCGRDLNEGDCDCREEHRDPRWDTLRKLAGS